jgi:hypothetical protein
MVTTQKTKLLIWVTILALAMACSIPSFTPSTAPTPDPGVLVATFIAQTVQAAGTQTVAALPSPTETPFATPTQPTATPTATSTAILVFFSPTPIVFPTFTAGVSNENYACQVTRVSPPNGSVFDPRDDFDVRWTVKNTGKRNWERTDVDYLYMSGAKIHKVSGYDLADDVGIGRLIDLGVDMRAPKDPGTYSTLWSMRRGDTTFCDLRFAIVVR